MASLEDKPLAPGLYIVPTPIGNLEDITLRALRVLRQADLIACEDTRQTQKLLHHFDIKTATVSYHQHNESGRAEHLVARLQAGGRIALVSDAGTPGINDPGSVLVAGALAAGFPVIALPGANAALTALVASGLPTEQFVYLGFLPSRAGERRTMLESLAAERRTMVFYESPHRITESLADIETALGSTRQIVIARELTKLHEEYLRGSVADMRTQLAARGPLRGEIVLLVSGATAQTAVTEQRLADRVRQVMKEHSIEEKDALKQVARERGLGKSEAYREWQRTKSR